MMNPGPQAEHRWLQRMLGDWSEGRCEMGPDDHRILRSRVRAANGQWHPIMQAHDRRI